MCHIGFSIPVNYTDYRGKTYLFHEIKPKIKNLDPNTVMERIFSTLKFLNIKLCSFPLMGEGWGGGVEDLRKRLFDDKKTVEEIKRPSSIITRTIRKLIAQKLFAVIPRSSKYNVT